MPRDALHVLVVDDNRDAAESLSALLELRQYRCRVALDGPSGLRAALESPPDCLISDIRMPGLDGYALARRVRGERGLAGVKLVAMSAYSDEEHTRKAAEAGFDYCLTKGDDPTELFEVLHMIEEIKELASRTQDLAKQNVDLAGQAKELLHEVKQEVKEVRQEIQEVKQDVKELKQEIKEIKNGNGSGEPPV